MVPTDTLRRIAIAAKGVERTMLVTDAMSTVGSDLTEFTLQGKRIIRAGGRLTSSEGVLAGSDLDMATAVRNVVRRVGHGHSPFSPDKRHLHHRMLQLGHTHRRAVLLLYFWSALLAVGGVTFAITHRPWTVIVSLVPTPFEKVTPDGRTPPPFLFAYWRASVVAFEVS